jgi:hypothetical protein
MSEIILVKLDELVEQYQNVISQQDNFSNYLTTIQGKLDALDAGCQDSNNLIQTAEPTLTTEPLNSDQTVDNGMLVSSNFKNLDMTRTQFEDN